MDKIPLLIFFLLFLLSCGPNDKTALTPGPHDLHFDTLADSWDEGIPLGNGMLGVLVWQKEGKLRLSLDRADLWDMRPMENLDAKEWKFSWVKEQWEKETYENVQKMFDAPYDRNPAPSKIPGAAMEIDVSSLGKIASVHLYIKEAICEVKWENGVRFLTFVHATEPIGWYRFEGMKEEPDIDLVAPPYNTKGKDEEENPVTGQDLRRLAYPQGKMNEDDNGVEYVQAGWGGFEYQVKITEEKNEDKYQGVWSISSSYPSWEDEPSASALVEKHLADGWETDYQSHRNWWTDYWSKSSVDIPDTILEKQWYLEQYKFGAAARDGSPPISLQSVWTADNGKLPPWKGDFHHDLNTQLSYWPAYSANHLEEEIGFINWLWKHRETFKSYTRAYFETEGINVPGVTTLTGEPMGGWIQYAFGPTVSSWLAHHFYLHWRYSMDKKFLANRAYPWIKDVAIYLKEVSEVGPRGFRQLPISSSPEIHNNSRQAWFAETTNFDLAFIRWTYAKAAELALELNLPQEASQWNEELSRWPDFAVDESGLLFAPGHPYNKSHRHLSNIVAYHPLGLIDVSNGDEEKKIIDNSIKNIDSVGSSAWVGYSFSWLGNIKARALDGEGAAESLRIFATSFCLPNSFHVNGDQSGKGYSDFTYRPFTLEGNFAFAAGIQEMLIQSHTGIIHVFPAIPDNWEEVSFDKLRTEGAFLVSAEMEEGKVRTISIESTMGGDIKLKNPFDRAKFDSSTDYTIDENNSITIETEAGQVVTLTRK